MKKLYEILGLNENATDEEIRKAYKQKAQKYHPDRESGDKEQFALVRTAYDVLKDPARKQRYDETGEAGPATNVDQMAVQVIAQLFSQAVEQENIKNPVASVKDHLENDHKTLAGQIEALDNKVALLEKRRKRLTFQGESNLLDGVIQDKIRQHKSARQTLEQQIEINRRAVAMLDAYDYESDETTKVAPVHNPFMSSYYQAW